MNIFLNTKKLVLLTLGICSVTFIQQASLQNLRLAARNPLFLIDSEIKEWQPVSLRRVPTAGFRNIVADYTFIKFLTYFGDESRLNTGYAASPAFFETIINKDPFFKDFYLFLSQSISINAGDPDRAISLMNVGVSHLKPDQPPDGYHILRYKGIDELLFAGDGKAAQSTFEKAAKWAEQSSQPDSQKVSQLSRQTAQFLAADPDSKQAQVSAWSSVLVAALDDETRQRAIDKIRDLGGEVVISESRGVSVMYPPAARRSRTSNKQSDI